MAAPPEVEVVVWGSGGFQTGDALVGAVIDAQGRPCAVDAHGISCFDDDGREAWGLALPGLHVVDLEAHAGGWALYGQRETVFMADDGRILDRVPGDPPWFEPEVDLPDDIDVVEFLDGGDERFGVLDGGGGLVWFDAAGNELEDLDLDLGVQDGLRVIELDTGWALLDDEGVVVLDAEGRITAEADVDAEDLVFADGELWLATDEGVLPMDLDTGEVGEPLVDGRVHSLAATADGEVLAVVDVGGRRLRAWAGDEELTPLDHADAVLRLSPLPDGGLVSVDGSGRAVRWTPLGVPTAVGDGLVDAVLDGAGGLWTTTGRGLKRTIDDGSGVGDLYVAPARLIPLLDGVLVGDGASTVERRDADGAVRWTNADLAHADGLSVAGGVVFGLAAGSAEVADLATGSPRRRLTTSRAHLRAAGVAVGGLVVVGENNGVTSGWRPPFVGSTRTIDSLEDPVALAPNGRWGAGLRPDGRVVVFETQGGTLYRAQAGADVTALAVDAHHVWLGRRDGRIERWDVHPLVVDAPLPHFNPYAQLEGFVAPPAGPDSVEETRRSGPIVDMSSHPGGGLAVASGGLDVSTPAADGSVTRWVPVLGSPRPHSAVHWDPELGLVVGTDDGLLLSIRDGRERTLAKLKSPVTALCAVPDGLLVATGRGVLRVSGRRVRTVPGSPPVPVGGLACDPEGRWALAVVGDGAAAWDLATGALLARPRQGGPIRSVGVLPDGTALTGGEDRTVVLWEPTNWQAIGVLEGHDGAVVDLAVDPDGLRLVAGGGSGAVVWDLVPLEPVARLAATDAVSAVAVDGSGQRVWLGTTEGGVHQFALPAPVGEPVDVDTDEPPIILDLPPPTIAPGALPTSESPPDER